MLDGYTKLTAAKALGERSRNRPGTRAIRLSVHASKEFPQKEEHHDDCDCDGGRGLRGVLDPLLDWNFGQGDGNGCREMILRHNASRCVLAGAPPLTLSGWEGASVSTEFREGPVLTRAHLGAPRTKPSRSKLAVSCDLPTSTDNRTVLTA